MAENSIDCRIKKEVRRLKRVFRDMDKNKLETVDALIDNAAFTRITLEDLQQSIITCGTTTEYKNGENQYGTKRSAEVDTHIAMTKNLNAIIKQLAEYVPPAKRKGSRLDALRGE